MNFQERIDDALVKNGFKPLAIKCNYEEMMLDLKCICGLSPFEEIVQIVTTEITIHIRDAITGMSGFDRIKKIKSLQGLYGEQYGWDWYEKQEANSKKAALPVLMSIDWRKLDPRCDQYFDKLYRPNAISPRVYATE